MAEAAAEVENVVDSVKRDRIRVVLVTLAVVFSATSALNATIYSATRTSYALGREKTILLQF